MRKKLILTALLFLTSAPWAHGQEKTLTISAKNMELRQLFDKIETQSNYLFFYLDNDVKGIKVSVDVEKASLKTLLDQVLSNTNLDWTLNGINVTIMQRNTQAAQPVQKGATGFTRGALVRRDTIALSRLDTIQQLEEVVVVAFGTQKRVNLTGSVATVSAKALESRPVQNAVQALQGLAPGLNISQASGELNATPTINIRGLATIGEGSTGNPLILIDGMEGNLNNINPQDIESISILKDAAASSIYGSRAPFGVILVTTKKGQQGKTVVNYNNSFRYLTPMIIPQIADSYTFAIYFNEGMTNNRDDPWFSAERIQRILDYQRGIVKESVPVSTRNPELWGDGYTEGNDNVDYYKAMFNRWSPSCEHNVSVSGGTESLNYYVSGNWLDKTGFLSFGGDDFTRKTLTGKINGKIRPWLDVNYISRLIRENYEQPYYLNSNFYFDLARQAWPMLPLYDPNGNLASSPSPPLNMRDGGRTAANTEQTYQQIQLVIAPLAGWKIFGEANFRFTNHKSHSHQLQTYKYNVVGMPILENQDTRVVENSEEGLYQSYNLWSEYNRRIGSHNLKATLGFQSEENRSKSFSAERQGIIIPSHTVITTTTGTSSATGATIAPVVSGNAHSHQFKA